MNKGSKVVIQILSSSFSILFWVLAVFGIGWAGKQAYQFGYRVFHEETMEKAPGTDKSVTFRQDMSEFDLAKKLEQKRLVQDAKLFYVQLELSKYRGKLQPGTYTLNTSMEAEEMISILAGNPLAEEQKQGDGNALEDASSNKKQDTKQQRKEKK